MTNDTKVVGSFRLRLSDFFWLQLLVIPLFLIPFYENQELGEGTKRAAHWIIDLLTIFVAPTAYVAAFSYRTAARALNNASEKKRSIVFAGIGGGMFFGALFGTLVFVASWVNWNWLGGRERFVAAGIYWEFTDQDLAMIGIVYLYLLSIGAAVGGLIGLAVGKLGRRRSPA
jgi:hypothetical protein